MEKMSIVKLVVLSSVAVSGTVAFNQALPTGFARRVAPEVVGSSFHPTAPSYHNGKRLQRLQVVSYPAQRSSIDDDSPLSWESVLTSRPRPSPEHPDITITDKAQLSAGIGLAVLSFYLLITMSAPGAWRYFMAGGICAATSHAIPTPVDVVKTRKQLDPTLQEKNFFQATRTIMKQEGHQALWAGLGPTTWGYLLEGSVKFGIYEVAKPAIKTVMSRIATFTSMTAFNSQLLAFIVCGCFSGTAASLMLCPMEALRIRMVAEPDFAPNGMIQGGYKMLKREGVSGMIKGLKPMLLKQVPYTVTKNVSFDIMTKTFYSIAIAQGIALTATHRFTIPLVSAAIASMFSCISSQPGDMLLSLVNAHEGDFRSRDIFRSILRSDRGVKGLFVGFKTRMLHVGIIVTLQLMIYDYVKRLVGIAATGSL